MSFARLVSSRACERACGLAGMPILDAELVFVLFLRFFALFLIAPHTGAIHGSVTKSIVGGAGGGGGTLSMARGLVSG